MSENEQQEERIEDLEVDEEDAEDVTGGRQPSPPSGPVPIPYPN
jgi:hypothetical protein